MRNIIKKIFLLLKENYKSILYTILILSALGTFLAPEPASLIVFIELFLGISAVFTGFLLIGILLTYFKD
ncbi:hypothetical protein [Pedobacter sp.]|uniref:hypothetical protein n=1 Tax=Pedobacter sp. TaxID=1411316 RepID=UPI003BAC9F86